jgi:colicin import membrane protein
MLADIQKQTHKEKKIKQKSIASEFEKDMKQMAARSLQQDMLQEQKKMAGARAQQVRGQVDKYKALILQTISQNWLIPPSVNKNLYAELMIRVAPGGVVLDVQVIKSSGDEGLDHSAQTAVFKSSPLPVPKDSDAFEPFRQFVLKVKPKDILNTENWES